MAQSAGSYINLMSGFVISFDSEYVQYMDREDKKVYQEKDFSDFETAMTNDDPSQSFEGYLDYMDRKNALLAKSKLTAEERVSLGEINKRLADYSTLSKAQIEIMQKETQEKIWSLNTGMFDFNNDDLTQQEVEQYKELFDRANKNESVLFQDVVSFDTKALIEAGIYNPYSNELKREPLIMAGRKMMNVLYEKEKLNRSTISVGEIHYNTGHFHVHFATTEVEPTREMIFVKEHNRYERKGQRSDETLEKMKSTFANLIFDRSSELERLNDLRNGLRSEIKTEMAAPKKESVLLLEELKAQLPENISKWNSKNLTSESRETMNQLIDSLMKDNGHFEEFKQLAKEEDIFKKAIYGEGDPNKEKKSFYDGRMYGPDGIYYRLGNSILQELKKENDSTSQRNSFRPSSLSGQQNPNKEIYNKMKQEYFTRKETNESRSPPKQNKRKRIKPFKQAYKSLRAATNQVKHLERVTSNEFDQFKNKVAFEKLQREIEQAKMSQESDLFN
ncbi:putative relaxase [Enterococcus saccharolyticus]|uniref:MobP2 family relaxase n=1 Tax=Enterococcus saccharolyticus TaxID=41997 RepID=UPI001024A58E|nr:MobP2 family relaxase [Enterococcus saccharolyticus]VFA67400.1 putative relaxase [Enterococcus saccharolyticus]VFA67435.1 putative relaxase [Enterococcus saccharolyticus]